jgi:transposase
MIRIVFGDIEKETISEALDDPSIDDRSKRKLMVLRMHDLNVPHAKIAGILNISDDTVTNYLNLYLKGGLDALLENRYYRPSSSVKAYLDQIKESLAKEPVATAKQGAARIEEISGVKLSEDQARRIMKQMGMQYRKTAAVPGEADGQMQLEFLNEELIPRLDDARQGRRRVFFVDAAHFVLGAFLGMIWCFARIFVRTGSGRQRYSVLGAIETRDHGLVSVRTSGSVNAETVCELMLKIERGYPGEKVTLVMDNARYQRNSKVQELAEHLGIELLYLPPYSPNLNLIERLWKLVKRKCLQNTYYPDFAQFRAAIDTFLDSLDGERKPLLRSLITENFQLISSPKI